MEGGTEGGRDGGEGECKGLENLADGKRLGC